MKATQIWWFGPIIAAATTNAPKKKKFVGANWKCSLENPKDVDMLVDNLNRMWRSLPSKELASVELCVHPPYVFIDRVRQRLDGGIRVGSQNVLEAVESHHETNTGTCNYRMLRAVGCDTVLLGHSDRRNNLRETDPQIADKVRGSLKNGLNVILTIGETKLQRRTGRTLMTLRKQLKIGLRTVPVDCWDRIVIAYEPVWAVGEGAVPCSPQEALRIHRALRSWIQRAVNEDAALACRITYTGSVNEQNAADYASLKDMDGFVVGRAGLDTRKLKTIIQALANSD